MTNGAIFTTNTLLDNGLYILGLEVHKYRVFLHLILIAALVLGGREALDVPPVRDH
jgi:hypothetical protein